MNINVLWTTLVTEAEIKAVLSGIRQFLDLFSTPKESTITIYGSRRWTKNGRSNSANDILANAGRSGYLVDAHTINQELIREFRNEIVVFVTTRQISEGSSYVFGLTSAPISTISVAPLRRLDPLWRHWAIVTLVMHELGHTHGMAYPVPGKQRATIKNSFGSHCTNPGCIMRQSYGLNEFVSHVKDALDKGRFFCPDCIREAREANRRKGWYQNPR